MTPRAPCERPISDFALRAQMVHVTKFLLVSKTLQQKVKAICYQAEANDADHHNSQGPDEKQKSK